jgi:hypothetical protein
VYQHPANRWYDNHSPNRYPELSLALAGLWWDAKGDWTRAHESAQQNEGPEGAGCMRIKNQATPGWYTRCRMVKDNKDGYMVFPCPKCGDHHALVGGWNVREHLRRIHGMGKAAATDFGNKMMGTGLVRLKGTTCVS